MSAVSIATSTTVTAAVSSERSRSTGRLIVAAARSLVDDPTVVVDVALCRAVSRSLALTLAKPHASRAEVLTASPFVIERSGKSKTLVEMIEQEDGDEEALLRLARLLLRALEWA